MFDYDTFMRLLDSVKSNTADPAVFYMSKKTHQRIRYITHASKAHLWEPRYKRRKCSIRRLTERRQSASKFYRG